MHVHFYHHNYVHTQEGCCPCSEMKTQNVGLLKTGPGTPSTKSFVINMECIPKGKYSIIDSYVHICMPNVKGIEHLCYLYLCYVAVVTFKLNKYALILK